MTFDDLAGLLSASRFLARGVPVEREALRAVPELADGLPPVVPDGRGVRVWSGASDAVRAAGSALAGHLVAAARGDAGPDLAGDPLVVAVERLIVEGARVSPGAAVVPVLEAVRLAQELLRSDPALAALRADPPALRRAVAAVQARLGTACARAATVTRVPALAFAVASDRLLPAHGRGTLDRDPAWGEIAALLDVPLPAGTVEAADTAVRLAVRGVVERRAAGRGTPDDAALLLRFLGPARLDPGAEAASGALLLDPDALAALLPALGRFVDAKALVAAGVDRARADALLTPASGLAVASVLGELVRALRSWDVLSQLVAAVGPAPVRALAAPRTVAGKAAVVAVGLTRLRTEGAASEAAWTALCRAPEGGVTGEGGACVVFVEVMDALRFALAARAALPGVALGLAWGPVLGGTDGRTGRFWGAGVDAAARWAASSAAPRPDGAEGGLRTVGGWLAGQGLAIDAAAAEAIHEARARQAAGERPDGPPAGDPRVPRSLDLHRVYDIDGTVLALVRVPGLGGGFEALAMGVPAWLALLDRDGERAAVPAFAPPLADPVAVAARAVAEPESDVGWEMAEEDELPEEAPVTLDLDEGLPGALGFGEAPGFDFGEVNASGRAVSEDAFSGFYLPAAEPAAATERPGELAPPAAEDASPILGALPPPRGATAPSTSVFDMPTEEDDEGVDWSGAGLDLGLPPPAPATPDPAGGLPVDPTAADPFPVAPAPAPPRPAGRGAPLNIVSRTTPTREVPRVLGRDVLLADPLAADPFAADRRAPDDPTGADVEETRDTATWHSGGSYTTVSTPLPRPKGTFSVSTSAPPGTPLPGAPAPAAGGDPFAADASDPFRGPDRAASSGGPERVDDPFTDFSSGSAFVGPGGARRGGRSGGRGAGSGPVDPLTPAEDSGDPFTGSGSSTGGRSGGRGGPDFDFLLKGYACYFERREAVFGRPYGTRMIDRHAYPYSGDSDEAYRAFLSDKIREGFLPRSELVADLPRGVTLMPLDGETLARAWSVLS